MEHPLLEYFIRIAEELDIGISLVVSVKGIIVEGITISEMEYYKEVWSALTDLKPRYEPGFSKESLDTWDSSLHDFMQSQEKRKNTEFMYFKDASIFSGSTTEYVEEPYWVGRVSYIDAFWIGTDDNKNSEPQYPDGSTE
jgi:hypothetical protein